MSVGDALKHTEAFYEERDLPPLALVRLGSPVEEEIRRLGWTDARPEQADVLVMHTSLDLVNAAPVYDVTVDDRPDAEWYTAAFEEDVPGPAPAVMEGAPRAAFASVRLDGRVVAVSRGSMTGHWLGVDAVRVHPEYRTRGLATAVLQGLTRWSGPLGGRRSYLEVVGDNMPALTTYSNLGYAEAYRYRYLTTH
jgi:GNAT superfamily N-acetyltransferase